MDQGAFLWVPFTQSTQRLLFQCIMNMQLMRQWLWHSAVFFSMTWHSLTETRILVTCPVVVMYMAYSTWRENESERRIPYLTLSSSLGDLERPRKTERLHICRLLKLMRQRVTITVTRCEWWCFWSKKPKIEPISRNIVYSDRICDKVLFLLRALPKQSTLAGAYQSARKEDKIAEFFSVALLQRNLRDASVSKKNVCTQVA